VGRGPITRHSGATREAFEEESGWERDQFVAIIATAPTTTLVTAFATGSVTACRTASATGSADQQRLSVPNTTRRFGFATGSAQHWQQRQLHRQT
jgi:hypothetical protein